MAPNLFLCLRNAFCPLYWFRPRIRIHGDICKDVHWTVPVPGIYRYVPGHGWHLIRRDDSEENQQASPEPVVYCQVLHQYMLASEMDSRCRLFSVAVREGAKPQQFRFFLLDDGATWVAAYDQKDRFIPGPYRKWKFDRKTMEMRPVTFLDNEGTGKGKSTSAI